MTKNYVPYVPMYSKKNDLFIIKKKAQRFTHWAFQQTKNQFNFM
jgi:hypothetical protein